MIAKEGKLTDVSAIMKNEIYRKTTSVNSHNVS